MRSFLDVFRDDDDDDDEITVLAHFRYESKRLKDTSNLTAYKNSHIRRRSGALKQIPVLGSTEAIGPNPEDIGVLKNVVTSPKENPSQIKCKKRVRFSEDVQIRIFESTLSNAEGDDHHNKK